MIFKQEFTESIKTVILKSEEISLVVENLPSAYEVLSSTSTGSISLKNSLIEEKCSKT